MRDFELIISDDSPDDSVEQLVKTYAFGVELFYQRNFPAKGSPENWNEALRRARGKYVKLMHHDDWFTATDSLQRFTDLLDNHPEADFAFSATNNLYETEGREEIYSPGAHRIGWLRHDPMHLMSANLIGAPSAVIVRRDKMQLYDPNLIWLVDIENYVRMIRRNNRFVFTADPLVTNTADLSERISGTCIDNPEVEIREHFYVYNKHKDFIANKLKHAHVIHLLKLLIRYRIKNVREIRKCGYNGSIPRRILLYFAIKPISGSVSARVIFKLIDMQMQKEKQK
jgi:glycosyltransferase involved in cell wall biosynthesis